MPGQAIYTHNGPGQPEQPGLPGLFNGAVQIRLVQVHYTLLAQGITPLSGWRDQGTSHQTLA